MNSRRSMSLCVLFVLVLGITLRLSAADEPGLAERAKETAKETEKAVQGAVKDAKVAVEDAGREVGSSFENLWRRADEGRLKNRSRDEVVAWVIMGVLVGAVAGMMTRLKPTGLGLVGRLLLGLAGACLGGMVGHLTKVDFGMGPVMIRYEELLFSFVGAILLIVVVRMIGSRSKKS